MGEIARVRVKHADQSLISALAMNRQRRRKVNQAKRASEEVRYLNIVAMMDMMTIILVFLLKSVSFATVSVAHADEMTLPSSSTKADPVEAIKVFITKKEITVEDTKIAEIEDGSVKPDYISPDNRYILTSLKKTLDNKAARLSRLQQLDPSLTAQDNLTILADRDTPYLILMQVLYTVSKVSGGEPGHEVSFGRYRLSVLKKEPS